MLDSRTKKTDRYSTLYSFKSQFELLYADIDNITFLGKSAVDPKYCLLINDLFTSEIYIYGVKS